MADSRLMQGLTLKSLKRHPSLVPLLAAIGFGAACASLYLGRLATRSPDVSWDRKNNQHPWLKMDTTSQYKFFAVSIDYDKLQKPDGRPDF